MKKLLQLDFLVGFLAYFLSNKQPTANIQITKHLHKQPNLSANLKTNKNKQHFQPVK